MKKIFFACALLSCHFAFSQDYWSKVPAFPTSCYSQKEGYPDKVSTAKTELKKISDEKTDALKKQTEKLTEADKMKVSMQYQDMTPDQIMKVQNEQMEMMTLQQAVQEKGTSVMNQFNDIEAQYNAEVSAKLAPLMEESRKLPDGEGTAQWAIDKGEQLAAQCNKEYEALCAKYFTGPQSPFKTWLADYKKYLLEYDIPYTQKMSEMQYRNFGLTGDNDLPVIDAVIRYNDYCHTIFSKRQNNPY